MADTLTWPLTLDTRTGRLVTVPQDDDIVSCVRCLLTTRLGWCTAQPDYGRPEVLFRQGGVDVGELAEQIRRFEPRATIEIVAQAVQGLSQTVKIDPQVAR